MTYTQVLHDGENQSNCHTLKNKRKIVQRPPSYQDSKDMQGWLAWDSYPVCTCTTETVPVLLRQHRLWSITRGPRLCTPPVAVHLDAYSSLPCAWQWHHLLETQCPAPFQGLISGCARRFPAGTREEPRSEGNCRHTGKKHFRGSRRLIVFSAWAHLVSKEGFLPFPTPCAASTLS